MKKLFLLLSAILIFSGCSGQSQLQNNVLDKEVSIIEEKQVLSNYVDVKYRDDDVNIANTVFNSLDTSKSSLIKGAWYDEDNEYMIIDLNGTYYHYCDIPESAWNQFKKAGSFGKHYNTSIKGAYDCKEGYLPEY